MHHEAVDRVGRGAREGVASEQERIDRMPVGVLVTVITLVVVVPVLLMVRRVLGGLSRQQAETRRLLASKPAAARGTAGRT